MSQLKDKIEVIIDTSEGDIAVAFLNLQDSSQLLLINERKMFHAASTMKTPVMVELFNQSSKGKFKLADSIKLRNEFISIYDSSIFSMELTDDSGERFYPFIGQNAKIYDLIYEMITRSSNLSTNILIDLVGAQNVTQSMRNIGANDILVLRGVEDLKAYEAGQSNMTNAYDLMLLFGKMAKYQLVDSLSSQEMINILMDQHFNGIIPASLPNTAKVAHKTGQITGILHDSGVVYLENGYKYVLIILSGGWKDEKSNRQNMVNISGLIHDFVKNQ